MDDLEFRRLLYADPSSKDPKLHEAKRGDSGRAKFAQELAELEDKISQAMAVSVPEGLSDKLILRQALASHRQDKRKKRMHLAIAASVAIGLGVLVNFSQFSSTYKNLGDYALAHVYHEINKFSNNMAQRVSLTSLNGKMESFNGSFIKPIGELLSADYCRFDGVKSLHLVFQGKYSPVNIFIVPKRSEVAFTKEFSDQRLNGEALDFGKNQVIVVGDKNESLSTWQQNINQNTTWTI
ncbi:DUF3379 family protein [Colwellia sp. MEBiC06753]